MTTKRFVLQMLLPVLAVSCGQDKGADNGDGMLVYSPQVNEVEVIRLEKTDFQWQLLANGKLTATKRSRLPFRTAVRSSGRHPFRCQDAFRIQFGGKCPASGGI